MALEFSGVRPSNKDLRRLPGLKTRTYGETAEISSAIGRPAGPDRRPAGPTSSEVIPGRTLTVLQGPAAPGRARHFRPVSDARRVDPAGSRSPQAPELPP